MKKIITNKYLPFFLLSLYIFILHAKFFVIVADDVRAFNAFHDSAGYTDWIYKDENSRFLLNIVSYYFLKMDYRVWWLVTAVLMSVIMAGLHYILFKNRNSITRYIMLIAMLLFPFHICVTVGWMMTTIAYIWTTACAVIACFSIRKYCNGEQIKWYEYLIYSVCLAFAADKEDFAVLLSVLFFCALCISIKEKKRYPVFALELVLSLASFAYAYFSSGNRDRLSKVEDDFTLIESVETGFSAAIQQVFLEYDFIFALVLVLMLALLIKKHVGIKKTLSTIYALMVWSLLGLVGSLIVGDLLNHYLFNDLLDDRSVLNGKYSDPKMILCMIAMLAAWVCLIFGIKNIFITERKFAFFMSAAMIAGICGRTLVGFGGNMQLYYGRAYAYLYFIIVALVAKLSYELYIILTPVGRQRLIEILLICVIFAIVKNVDMLHRLYIEVTENLWNDPLRLTGCIRRII